MDRLPETTDPPIRHWADVRFDIDYIAVVAHSGYRSTAMDPDRYFQVHPHDMPDPELAASVRRCLRASRFLSLDEAQTFFVQARDPGTYTRWVDQLLQRTGRSSRARLFRTQRHILITEIDGDFNIAPSIRVRTDLFHGLPERTRSIRKNADDLAIGMAIRGAMADCN